MTFRNTAYFLALFTQEIYSIFLFTVPNTWQDATATFKLPYSTGTEHFWGNEIV